MKKFYFLLAIYTLLAISSKAQIAEGTSLYTGFRASRILQSYPQQQFPAAQYWNATGKTIAAKFSAASPAGIWIVSTYWENGNIGMNFPSGGLSIPYINFGGTDQNESFLKYFDTSGIKVWLQVEPGAASIDTLISIVLNRYKHHPCVLGFGIDVEWYQANLYPNDGKKVTDTEAMRWEQKVKAVDTNYTLFLKHYGQSWMPPTYRGKILFVDDSQQFTSLNQMVTEFKSWAAKFAPAQAAFQFGYPADSIWWRQYPDPMKTLGSSLLANITNCAGLFWVDFTITKVFPLTSVSRSSRKAEGFRLEQNFPNPFNPSTKISYTLPENTKVLLRVFDAMGSQVATLVNLDQARGSYSIDFTPESLPSGVYFYILKGERLFEVKSMILLK
ncbi:MAG: T9SS type A sorting domain-containing protein [Ignavibacteriales bacterium]|nr:T9SS type A sorting domain-containing protein [Ignavibacteriales bacterium]